MNSLTDGWIIPKRVYSYNAHIGKGRGSAGKEKVTSFEQGQHHYEYQVPFQVPNSVIVMEGEPTQNMSWARSFKAISLHVMEKNKGIRLDYPYLNLSESALSCTSLFL